MLKIKSFNQSGEFKETALTPETSIQGQCTIGRTASCDLVLNSPQVSRVHGRIMFQNGQYYFTDIGSKNGSRINTEEVKANQSYVLKEDDIIRIADNVILIEAIKTPPSGGDAILGEGRDSVSRWSEGDLTVRCIGVIYETADVKAFCFVASPPVLFTYKPGQFVTLELEVNGEEVLGVYPISSTPSRPHSLEITVKRVPTLTDATQTCDLRETPDQHERPNVTSDLVDNWLYSHITVGSEVRLIGGPIGNFTCFDKPEQKLLMISAQGGITPMMSMTRWVHDTSASSNIVFVHSARSPSDIIFRQELEMMAARLTNFRLAITTTSSEPGEGNTCRVTEAMLNAIAPDIRERTVYVCGPDSFMQAVKAMLESLAFPMQNYYSQSLGAAKTDKNISKTAVKDLSIPPAKPFTNGRRVATDLSSNSPLSTGLPALYEAYPTVGGHVRQSAKFLCAGSRTGVVPSGDRGRDGLFFTRWMSRKVGRWSDKVGTTFRPPHLPNPPSPHYPLYPFCPLSPKGTPSSPEGATPVLDPAQRNSAVWRTSSPIFRRVPMPVIAVGPILLLSSFAIGLNTLSGNDQGAKAPLSINISPVETIQIKPVESYQVSRTYTGEIAARRSSELGFERSGQLVFVAVDEGDRVNTLEPLARLDTSNLEAERRKLLAQRAQAVAQLNELQAGPRPEKIAAARASVRQSSEQFELARTKHSRRKMLYAEGAISREQLEEVAFEAGALKASLDEATSNLDELLAGTRSEQIAAQTGMVRQLDASIASIDIDLAKSTIKAPFAGTISKRLVDEGTVVSSGQSILRLVEKGGLEARIGVPVSGAANLKPGSKQKLLVGQKTYEAVVRSLQPELDSSTRTLSVVLTLDESVATVIHPGQLARLELVETIPTSGYWLPTTVLARARRGLWSCYVMAKDQKRQENQDSPSPSSLSTPNTAFRVEQRDVEILHTESDRVLVRGTLQPGDQVIVNGTHRIVPGQLVRPAQL